MTVWPESELKSWLIELGKRDSLLHYQHLPRHLGGHDKHGWIDGLPRDKGICIGCEHCACWSGLLSMRLRLWNHPFDAIVQLRPLLYHNTLLYLQGKIRKVNLQFFSQLPKLINQQAFKAGLSVPCNYIPTSCLPLYLSLSLSDKLHP